MKRPLLAVPSLIAAKRDGRALTDAEVRAVVTGAARGDIPDYQISAWLMAVWIRGMSRSELAALTEVMLYSGEVLNFSDFPGKKVDKHSTGGVGDKTSLILAPIVAAGGLTVPMISGRGLGHTGRAGRSGGHLDATRVQQHQQRVTFATGEREVRDAR